MVGDSVKPDAKLVKAVDPKKLSPDEARRKALEEAAQYGMLSLLGAGEPSRSSAILGPANPSDVWGGVVGGTIGAGGFGGLGLSGGGGTGEGIGLGTIGTLGSGSSSGFGHGGLGTSSDRVKAKIEAATVEGPLLGEVVQRILGDHREDLQACYLLEIARGGRPRGRVTLVFTIDPKGDVIDVRVPEASLGQRDLQACVAQVTGTFKFPAPSTSSDVKVTVPINF
jgi:TonB family protein